MNVLVYGMGEFYQRNKDILVPSCYNVCAFISQDNDNETNIFEGKPVITFDKIGNSKFDKIIIATERWIKVERKLLDIGVEFDKIIIPIIISENCNHEEIQSKIKNLKQSSKKPKLAIISYLSDIFVKRYEKYLKDKYETVYITLNLQESRYYINEIVNNADICFFEWGGSPLVFASYMNSAINKPIITRMHRYEVYTNTIKGINWSNVDNVIFIADHIMNKFEKTINISKDKLNLIYNGFEIEKFTFKYHSKGYNIAYVGALSYRKNIQLIMFIIKKLKNINCNYKLYLAGEFESNEYRDYINHIIEQLNIKENVFFSGQVSDINLWLDDKDYIICSSTSEGHITSIQEAMLKGIKPIIYNYEGADEIYPEYYLWNELEEAVDLITEERYDSKEYRNLITNKFDIRTQSSKLCELIDKTYNQYKKDDVFI